MLEALVSDQAFEAFLRVILIIINASTVLEGAETSTYHRPTSLLGRIRSLLLRLVVGVHVDVEGRGYDLDVRVGRSVLVMVNYWIMLLGSFTAAVALPGEHHHARDRALLMVQQGLFVIITLIIS